MGHRYLPAMKTLIPKVKVGFFENSPFLVSQSCFKRTIFGKFHRLTTQKRLTKSLAVKRTLIDIFLSWRSILRDSYKFPSLTRYKETGQSLHGAGPTKFKS